MSRYMTEFTLQCFDLEFYGSRIYKKKTPASDLCATIDAEFNAFRFENITGSVKDGLSIYDAWYSFDEDICDLSKRYSTILFSVYGAGENNEDLWVAYVLNGKMQRSMAQVVYEEFAPDKLVQLE